MKKILVLSLMVLCITTVANAQATRTWVSGVGDDVNPCSRTAPCKTFAGAISKTATGGIINCLDPGGFGVVTITKSIMIDCTGTLGSVLASGTQGIVINGLTNSDIILRNIDISGAGTTIGTNGINVVQAGTVNLQHVYIETFSATGVETTNSSNAISVFLYDTYISNTGNVGVFLANSGTGTAKLTADGLHISKGGNVGIDLNGANDNAFVTNSSITKSGIGIQVENGTSQANLETTSLTNNNTGVVAGTGGASIVRLSRCFISGNTTNGVSGTGSTLCFGTNVIAGNTGTQTCTSTNPPNTMQ